MYKLILMVMIGGLTLSSIQSASAQVLSCKEADNTSCINAPTNLSQTNCDYGRCVVFSWTDNSLNEIGFTIERSAEINMNQWVEIARVGANVTTYTDSKFAFAIPTSRYEYRIRAYNGNQFSNSSNVIQVYFSPRGKVHGYARKSQYPYLHLNTVVELRYTAFPPISHFTQTDDSGYFEFNDILRSVTSSGGQTTWLDYNLFINGVQASPLINLRDPFTVRQDAIF